MTKRALIVGCGDIGCRTGLRLLEAGYDIIGLRRQPAALPPLFEGRAFDIYRPDPAAFSKPADVVLFAASANQRTPSDYQQIYYEGLAFTLDQCRQWPTPPTVMFISSTSIYAQNNGEWIDESSAAQPDSPTAQQIRAAELLLGHSGLRYCIVRPSGIYGPGRGRLLDVARRASAAQLNDRRYGNRIHADDLAGFLAHLIVRGHSHPIYLASDNCPTQTGEVLRWLQQQMGVSAASRSGPELPMRGNKRIRKDRMLGTGYTLMYPDYRSGYLHLLADHNPPPAAQHPWNT